MKCDEFVQILYGMVEASCATFPPSLDEDATAYGFNINVYCEKVSPLLVKLDGLTDSLKESYINDLEEINKYNKDNADFFKSEDDRMILSLSDIAWKTENHIVSAVSTRTVFEFLYDVHPELSPDFDTSLKRFHFKEKYLDEFTDFINEKTGLKLKSWQLSSVDSMMELMDKVEEALHASSVPIERFLS